MRPGSSPRGCAGSPDEAARNDERTDPAARCHHGGVPTSTGFDSADRVAVNRSPPSGGCSRASRRTRCPGSTLRQPAAGPSTSTSPLARTRLPDAVIERRCASTATRGEPAGPLAVSNRGSAVTVNSAVTGRRSRAISATGESRARASRAASGSSTTATQNAASARAARTGTRRAPTNKTAPAPAATRASTSTRAGEVGRHAMTAPQPAIAPTASRTSTPGRATFGAAYPRAGDRSPAGARTLTPSPVPECRRTCSARCRTPRATGRSSRSARGPYASRRCAGPAPVQHRAMRPTARESLCSDRSVPTRSLPGHPSHPSHRGRPAQPIAPGAAAAGTPTAICSPSATLRARLSELRSTPGNGPPAARSTSSTREPSARRYTPG